MDDRIIRIVLAGNGVFLIFHSVFFWMNAFQYQHSLFENGPTAVFIMEQLLWLSHWVSLAVFLAGIMALVKAAFYPK